MTQFSEDDVTDILAYDWWRASSENLRKASARVRESLARQEEKKRGGVGGGRQERKREGWVGEGKKKEGKGVGDDVIEKINKK